MSMVWRCPADYVEDRIASFSTCLFAARCANFGIADGLMTFDSRFGGQPFRVVAPLPAVVAVYAKETGQGMAFELGATPPVPAGIAASGRDGQTGPTLTVVP